MAKKEKVKEEVKKGKWVAIRDINRKYRKGDTVPEDTVYMWEKNNGLDISLLVERR